MTCPKCNSTDLHQGQMGSSKCFACGAIVEAQKPRASIESSTVMYVTKDHYDALAEALNIAKTGYDVRGAGLEVVSKELERVAKERDALKEELETSKLFEDQYHHERNVYLAERDKLQRELTILKDPSDGRCMEIGMLRQRRDDDAKEIARLRAALEKINGVQRYSDGEVMTVHDALDHIGGIADEALRGEP